MPPKRLNVLLLEPFYGGSHKAFVDGIRKHSRHRVEALTLPARFWKWRMRGAAILLAQRMEALENAPDVILASDMLSVADLKALLGKFSPPVLLYMHENQLSYPVPKGEAIDFQFGFTNITSCLAAEQVVFNSTFHQDAFLRALPGFLRMMPDCRPKGIVEDIREKVSVLPLGCDFAGIFLRPRTPDRSAPLTLLWNHRWEFDKAPEVFFDTLYRLQAERLKFRVIVCGENFQAKPKVFLEAKQRLRRRLVHFGYEPSRARYARLLSQADIVVSTAVQENFGLSVIEAVYAGCLPLLPRRLSYPEILPAAFHEGHLYDSPADLYQRLRALLRHGIPSGFDCDGLRKEVSRYDWRGMIKRYDEMFDATGRRPKKMK
jgi:glycosyltransferase involved in cell wall biosynthesis